MDTGWTAPIDIYCERLAPGFWAEPVNAITNAAFLIAALLVLVRWIRRPDRDWPVLALIVVLTMIGIGSFLFHTFADRWSVLTDVIPIAIFIYVYFFFAMRRFFGFGMAASLAITIAFLTVSYLVPALLPDGFLNGSGSYLPALVAILVVGALIVGRHPETGRLVLAGGVVLALSLTFRSIDMAVCGGFPLGTHFLWHVLNGVTLYILLIALMGSGVRPKKVNGEISPSTP